MSLGIPAVSSPVGLEGLAVTPGRDLLVAADPLEWASQICLLLREPQKAEAIARAGRQYVQNFHSWNAQFHTLDEQLTEIFP
jgi:spore maturation protein CgeB